YYYLADDFGQPGAGAWSSEAVALAAWEASEASDDPIFPEADVTMDDRGNRVLSCAYCGHEHPYDPTVPDEGDDAAWEAKAGDHAEGCEWIATRAHRRAAD